MDQTLLPDLKGMTPQEIDRFCTERLAQRPGQGLRAAALLFRNRLEDPAAMTGLNRAFREQLRSSCRSSVLVVERTDRSDDGTVKLLYRLDDGHAVEGVLIPMPERFTLCVSSQVGCASQCGFCLTGRGGFIRNLSTAEMVSQVFAAQGHAGGRTISNLVLMGTGEPLNNYDAVVKFITIAADRGGMAFSPRRVTLSTCGIAPLIERLADDGVPASLAVSLNASTDAVRSSIMPVNDRFPLAHLLRSLRYYAERTGSKVTIEYVLFKRVNDSPEDARRLCALLEGLPCMVNLLPFNPFPGASLEQPDAAALSAFRDILIRNKIVAVVRKSKGRDILAACGQLRADRS